MDDEINVLQAFQRHLHKEFNLYTATSGDEGLKIIGEHGPFAVVVSDLRMPIMDGITFLTKVKESWPDTVRMMLTGHADLQAAIEAINQGQVFRFMLKPCSTEHFINNLKDGIEIYRLRNAEKELLEGTLAGAISVLMDVLQLAIPEAFGRSSRITDIATRIARRLNIKDIWQIETSALLSHIGWVILPPEIIQKLYEGLSLNDEERHTFEMVPLIGAELISKIPRLEAIASNIAYQEKGYDGSGVPRDKIKGEEIPLGARILRVAQDFDTYKARTRSDKKTMEIMEAKAHQYDPKVLKVLKEMVLGFEEEKEQEIELSVEELEEGMVFVEDVKNLRGQLLIAKGNRVTSPIIERLKNFNRSVGVKEPIKVVLPRTKKS